MRAASIQTKATIAIGFWLALVFSAIGAESRLPAIIPLPQRMTVEHGVFRLRSASHFLGIRTRRGTRILSDAASTATAQYLAQRLRRVTGYRLPLKQSTEGQPIRGAILLTTVHAKASLGPEGYELTVAPDAIVIRAPAQAGLFYGVQTLLQLFPPKIFSPHRVRGVSWTAPCVHIADWPRFKWRGFMLDVSRHFFTVKEVETLLDAMAMHKLNVFHWHLVDMDGWRIQIKKYPKLTRIGAWRKSIGFGLNPKASTAYGPDGRYGGYYTQKEIRQVVAYAKARHIRVVPEIEMPGHSTEVMAAYPQLSCFGGHYSIDRGPHYRMGVFCPGKKEVYTFLENVLSEVFELFPSPYIHIGGDEVNKTNWKKSPACQALMKKEGLKNVDQLQSYFLRRIDKFIQAHGRTMVGWSEIAEGGLPPGAVLMDWIGGAAKAAREGHDVVMTPTTHCYFDYYQSLDHSLEPRAAGGYIPLWKVYDFKPIPAKLAPKYRSHILGAQANLWTEFVPSLKHAEYMAFPRLCALSEVVWSSKTSRNWKDFQRRLAVQVERLQAMGINYRHKKCVTIGQWKPAMLSTNEQTRQWNVTAQVKGSGKCHLIFDYRRGSCGLKIENVELTEDGHEMARDDHVGLAGAQPNRPVYLLAVRHYRAGARYTVRAEIAGAKGTDSSGTVSLAFVPTK